MYEKSAEPRSVGSNVAWMQMYANPPNVPALSVMFDWTEEPPSAYVESEQRPSTVGSEPRGGASRSWTPAGFPRRPGLERLRVRGSPGPLDRVTRTFVASPLPDQSLVSNTIRVPFSCAGLRPREPSIADSFFSTLTASEGARTHPDCHAYDVVAVIAPAVPRTSTM